MSGLGPDSQRDGETVESGENPRLKSGSHPHKIEMFLQEAIALTLSLNPQMLNWPPYTCVKSQAREMWAKLNEERNIRLPEYPA